MQVRHITGPISLWKVECGMWNVVGGSWKVVGLKGLRLVAKRAGWVV